MRLIRGLHESGYNKADVVNLFNFIDWTLGLPKPLEVEFWRELQTYEEGRKVAYITSVERIGYDRGKAEADQNLELIDALSIEQLESLGEALLDFESIDDLTTWLDR